jgi:hypothetical protein
MIILNVLSEVLLLTIHIYSSIFLDPEIDEEQAMSHGWIIVFGVGTYICVNWVLVLYFMISNLVKVRKMKKFLKLTHKE